MKFLTLTPFLAGVAQAIRFLNDDPAGTYFTEGTNYVLRFEADGQDHVDSFRLRLVTELMVPILVKDGMNDTYDFQDVYTLIAEAVQVADGSYTWPIEIFQGREGEKWVYRWEASYTSGNIMSATYLIPFHVQAAT